MIGPNGPCGAVSMPQASAAADSDVRHDHIHHRVFKYVPVPFEQLHTVTARQGKVAFRFHLHIAFDILIHHRLLQPEQICLVTFFPENIYSRVFHTK